MKVTFNLIWEEKVKLAVSILNKAKIFCSLSVDLWATNGLL